MTPVPRIGVLASHPIQYHAPWFRALAQRADVEVLFAHRPDRGQQGEGFGVAFEWDVDLLSGYQHRFLENVSAVPNSSSFSGCDTPSVLEVINAAGYSAFIVCGWNLKCYWQAVRACRARHVPVLVRGDSQLHAQPSILKRAVKRVIYPVMLRQFDGFLAVGTRNREYLRHYGVSDRKTFSAPHFVDNQWFAMRAEAAAQEAAELRRSLVSSPKALVALFVGKFIPKKRPGDLLAAVGMMPVDMNVVPVMLGAGELESELRTQASALKERVVFLGFKNQSELPKYYAAADVLVLPSDGGETWGLVVNEAMACGKPALVSETVGCAPDLIEPGVTGFTFPLGDIRALSECLARLTQAARSGKSWAAAVRQKISAFSPQAAAEGTILAINRLLAR